MICLLSHIFSIPYVNPAENNRACKNLFVNRITQITHALCHGYIKISNEKAVTVNIDCNTIVDKVIFQELAVVIKLDKKHEL